MGLSVVAALLVALSAVPYLKLPPEWSMRPPPDNAKIAAVWMPVASGKPDGRSILLVMNKRLIPTSLADEVSQVVTSETTDGRTIKKTTPHMTCNEKLAGEDVTMTFGRYTQIYHVAVEGDQVFTLIFTLPAGRFDEQKSRALFDSFFTR